MKTDQLIAALSADAPTRSRSVAQSLYLALPFGVLLAVLVHLALFSVRPDLVAALHTARYLFKIALMLMLAFCGLMAMLQLSRPTGSALVAVRWLIAPLVLLFGGVSAELLVLPQGDWMPAAMGFDRSVCLVAVPVMSAGPMVAAFFALKAGATTHPRLAALAAGLFSGGVAATIYALHCPNDSPLYLALWYLGGIALTALAGTGFSRMLRW